MKASAQVAAVATGLAMATSLLSLAPMAHAAALTDQQVSSIVSLLQSFGADSATIANVQASLTGGTPVSTGTGSSSSSSCSFTGDLTIGSTGAAVSCLQSALKSGGYMTANATGYFGALTRAGVIAWQKAAGVTPTAGYFGAKSRAAFNLNGSTGSTGGTTIPVGTGTGLKVMLSPTSPNGTVLVQGQAIGDLADFAFANPTANPINVTALSFKRSGVSNDATLTNVYLYNGGTRLTDSAGISNSAFSFSDPVALFTVPAGGSYVVSVRSDIAGSTSGQQVGVQLVSATSNGTLDSSVSFPVTSGYQTVSAANLATVVFQAAASTLPATNSSLTPANDVVVWQNTVSISTNSVKLSSLRLTNLGSIDSANVTNLRLYVDGVQAGTATMSGTRTATFDLSAAPVSLTTSNHTIKVLANITGGSSRTLQFSVQRSSDAMFVDNQLGQPVTLNTTNTSTTFSAASSGVQTIAAVTASSGVSVSRNSASPTQQVAVGATNVEWARFDMLASGENVKVSDLYVSADSSVHNGGLTNGKIMVNGVQVGSTKNIGEETAATTDFSLGSSLILPAGQTTVVSVFADAKTATSTNLSANETVTVSLDIGTSNAQGQSSLTATNVPTAQVSGNALTVSSSSLSASKYTGFGNQTVVAGTNNAKLGAFVLAAGSTEGVTVNTIALTLSAANAASITNLTLKDDATGTVLGSIITTPSGTTNGNQFSVNFTIAASGSKVIDIYANVLSSANAGSIQASVDTSTSGIGTVTGIATNAALQALQTITIGNGTLTITRGAGDPTSANVLAGASSVMVGEFNFAAQNSAYTVQNLAVIIPNSVATSVTNVTLSYKDVNGATQTQTQGLAVDAALPFATATFTGLTMNVPMNDSANLAVYVGTPTIASGATSGAGINVQLDMGNSSTAVDNTFRAINSAGAPITVAASAGYLASNGTFYVRKSIPTFAMKSVSGNAIGSPLYQFSITADPAGAVEWSKLTFTVATSAASSQVTNLTAVYLVDDASGANLLDNQTTSASTTATAITIDLTKNATAAKFQQVAAGTTKTYDLYGTVTGFTTGGSLSIKIAQDTNTVTNGSADGTGTAIVGTALNIWSDRSASGHTVSTADWTNGYLVKNFTNNQVTYSK